jgi:hypothetical protein
MAKAEQYNMIGTSLSQSQDMLSTCNAIEHSGMAKGLLEAVDEIDELLFNIEASNDNYKNN